MLLTIVSVPFVVLSCQNETPEIVIEKEEEYTANLPLIYHMAFFQRYAGKLYFAGQEENWELADIYTHELEEVAELIIDSEDIDKGINRSKLMETMFLPQIEEMEKTIDAGDKARFLEQYDILIKTCNACHNAAKYGAIKVTAPKENSYNQDFSVPEKED